MTQSMNQSIYVAKNCRRCQGSGIITLGFVNRIDETVDCPACEGKGVVRVLEPASECPRCKGSGNGGGSNVVCRYCGGRGWALSEMSLEAHG